jgi:hypothetical protein
MLGDDLVEQRLLGAVLRVSDSGSDCGEGHGRAMASGVPSTEGCPSASCARTGNLAIVGIATGGLARCKPDGGTRGFDMFAPSTGGRRQIQARKLRAAERIVPQRSSSVLRGLPAAQTTRRGSVWSDFARSNASSMRSGRAPGRSLSGVPRQAG